MFDDNFSLEPLSKQNDVKNFKMGDNAFQPLKTFLQKQALDFQLSLIAQTYVAIPNSGQYFTPRYVIDMCVKMPNPQEHETLIDTASGSCRFLPKGAVKYNVPILTFEIMKATFYKAFNINSNSKRELVFDCILKHFLKHLPIKDI